MGNWNLKVKFLVCCPLPEVCIKNFYDYEGYAPGLKPSKKKNQAPLKRV